MTKTTVKTEEMKVIEAIERAYQTKERIRVFYGNQENGVDWMEELDVMGKVSKSVGPQQVYILLNNMRSMAGGQISTSSIVKITSDKSVVYKHPNYTLKELTINRNAMGSAESKAGYEWNVRAGGMIQANFTTEEKARKYVEFLQGKRNSK